jgi:ABC-type lipoprotein release transport system permease subunit
MTQKTASTWTRSRSLAGHAASAMARRRGKNLALGGALACAVALVAAVLFLSDALRAESTRASRAMPDVTVEKLVAGRPSTISAAAADSVRGFPSVRAVEPRVWGYLFVPSVSGNITIVGVPAGAPAISASQGSLAKGRDLVTGEHEMIAGTGLVSLLGLEVGDRLGLPSPDPNAHPLKLVGTFASSVDLFTSDVVLCDEADARSILGLPAGEATDLAVWLTNPDEAHVVAEKIGTTLPGSRIIERDLLARIYALTYGRRAGLFLAAAIPALLALLVLAWDRASGLGPDEKREIAVLKAVGWSTNDVLSVKMLESLFVSFFAATVGLGLAYLWVFPFGAPGLRPALAGWSVLYPAAHLTPEVDLTQLVSLAFAIVAPFVGLSIVPAWRAATMDPMEAMRGS